MTKVIICGGRDFDNFELLSKSLDEIFGGINDEIEIVSGSARGADSLGERYAKSMRYPVRQFKPDWAKYGRGAGIVRNKEMLQYILQSPNPIVIGFWDGVSKGTGNMLKQARSKNAKVYEIRYCGGKK